MEQQGNWPPHVIDEIRRQLSQFGRIGATKVMAVPELGAAIPAGQIVQATPLQFREPGIVTALYGQELSGTADMFAKLGVRVQIGGQEDIFTDGNVGVFRSLLGLVGGAQNWFPLWRRAVPGQNWVISYRNRSDSESTPEVSFAFLADADIARYAR